MKLFRYFFEKLLLPFLLSAPVITLIVSKFNTGQWTGYFDSVTKKEWFILIGVLLILLIVRGSILKIIAIHRKNNTGFGFAVISVPLYGWKIVGSLEYNNLIWRIKVPNEPRWDFSSNHHINPADIQVETPPRCPKCQTEIEQKHKLIAGYLWICVSCNFKKRNKDSYYKVANRVEKIARRKIEEEIEKKVSLNSGQYY